MVSCWKKHFPFENVSMINITQTQITAFPEIFWEFMLYIPSYLSNIRRKFLLWCMHEEVNLALFLYSTPGVPNRTSHNKEPCPCVSSQGVMGSVFTLGTRGGRYALSHPGGVWETAGHIQQPVSQHKSWCGCLILSELIIMLCLNLCSTPHCSVDDVSLETYRLTALWPG